MVEKYSGEQVVRDIKKRTRRKYSSEEKIRINHRCLTLQSGQKSEYLSHGLRPLAPRP